jgi:lipopolysaccharide transport system permease protein
MLTALLAFAIATWLAAVTVQYRDVRHALPFMLQAWFFVTPIIYPISVIPAKWRWIVYINPLTGIIEGIRAAVAGRGFGWSMLITSAGITAVIFAAGIYGFRRTERTIADLI